MIIGINATHDPGLRSWVTSANATECDFPIQNLPFAVFRRAGDDAPFGLGVAIGDQVLGLRAMRQQAQFRDLPGPLLAACEESSLNRLMSLGHDASSRLREHLSIALREGAQGAAELRNALVPQSDVEYGLPAAIGDYTDFYTSIHHATTVGRQFRPDNPLLPNYQWMPIAYHGRSSSVLVSGHAFARPVGQRMPPGASTPSVGPAQRLDFELEVGVFVGRGNAIGSAIPIGAAESHAFGICLLNDWSARDIQAWEYQPLGPFLGKNFATTISPWVVTVEALAPFRLPFSRPATDPQPLPYLVSADDQARGMFDMALEVSLQTHRMREDGLPAERLALSNFRHCYWTIAQMIAHHTVNGCNLRAGDLLGSGTVSGPLESEAGSLLELTAGGKRPLTLRTTETRSFLEDGDSVVLRAWCERAGATRIGFGSATATVSAARTT